MVSETHRRLLRTAATPVALLLFTLWLASHSRLDLWLTSTWATGGDVASQVLYAKIFMTEWFFNAKITGWLPEVFCGFPAFTYYFPFPFSLMALLSSVIVAPVSFKIVSMSGAFLIPAATYLFGRQFGWPAPTRWLAAAGAAGFILTEETSIWGGNILSQLAGEFAYAWGMTLTISFWGLLRRALHDGGRWWVAAALCEAAVAMSHGYGLLVAGFGAFFLLLEHGPFWRALRTILQVHTAAFLLVGFWLIPLAANLPWTIPNDTSFTVDHWQVLWPASLWPFALGFPALIFLRVRNRKIVGLPFLLCIGGLGLLGFHGGHLAGFAEARFFPYGQWAVAVALGATIGQCIATWNRAPALLTLAAMVALMAWWEPHIEKMEQWSRWNLEGYEIKPMWPTYRQLAVVNSGPLSAPRVLFEHDPDNNDLGSTRTLEALPLFGSKPVLEGLYMESSITSPFIYQVQHEASERPSSPLSRFPTTRRSVDQAVLHMNELYSNRLILRSNTMKARYSQDPRFRLVADIEPFKIFELTTQTSQLVDVVQTPLVTRDREDWLHHAFRRFVVKQPYTERTVYLGKKQAPPIVNDAPVSVAAPELVQYERERIVFRSKALGKPHLIRVTFHPRWRVVTGETIYLAEPSFMLVVPQHETIELQYANNGADYLGSAFSVFGLLLVGYGGWTRSKLTPTTAGAENPLRLRHTILVICILGGITALTWWADPEHIYFRAHAISAQGQWQKAATLFDSVRNRRRNPAGQAEALFWAARCYQIAGDSATALLRYQDLVARFGENYWYAESVFRIIELERAAQHESVARHYLELLEQQQPDNEWTTKARQLLGPIAAQPAPSGS